MSNTSGKILSICIPTYNRIHYLKECIDSIMVAARGYEDKVEIVISDNASSDGSEFMVKEYPDPYKLIRYSKNDTNIGPAKNIHKVAEKANGKYVWIFGDDDKASDVSIRSALAYIEKSYGIIVFNYSIWSLLFDKCINPSFFTFKQEILIDKPEELMSRFGLGLGFISCVVIEKERFLTAPENEYAPYFDYGFSHLYSIYVGIRIKCIAIYSPEVVIFNRSGNSNTYDWYKYFVTGSNLIFNALHLKGYSKKSVWAAKHGVLRVYILSVIYHTKLHDSRNCMNYGILIARNYWNDWLFWLVVFPFFLTPVPLLKILWFVKKQLKQQHNKE